jgi:glutamine amidotransferase
MIALVDYGMGNLQSVANALESLGRPATVTAGPEDLRRASGIILPGVGAFGDGMRNLRASGMVDALNETVLQRGTPFLGLCLGMQFLAARGEENGVHEGLGWIPGTVQRLIPPDRRFKVPHMGWNEVRIRRKDALLEGLDDRPVFYFVHGYHFVPDSSAADAVTSTCWHGVEIVATVGRDNVFGVQFHPEKSQRDGVRLLENFLSLVYGR